MDKNIDKICNCEIFSPFTKNGNCRFCYGYKEINLKLTAVN